MGERLQEDCVKRYAKAILDLIGMYSVGTMHISGKISKEVKHYLFQPVRSTNQEASNDADRAKAEQKSVVTSK